MSSVCPDRLPGSFHPPQRTLMGPGPSNMHPRVLAALARPIIGHLDPAFVSMMEEVKVMLRQALQTDNALTFPASGPGSVGMEMTFANLVEPGDVVVVGRNGVFGGRMIENVRRMGGEPVVCEAPWGQPIDPDALDDCLRRHPQARLVAFVHGETSTGVLSDAAALCAVARRHGCLTLVDAVTSLAGVPLQVDAWGIDALYSGTQKCLSCVPGLSPVTFSERAIERVRQRRTPVQSWFMDINLLLGYWGDGQRTYHHTAPINPLYALHEALLLLHEEGLAQVWARHQRCHRALKAGLDSLGLQWLVPEAARLPQMNALLIPDGLDDREVRRRLLEQHNLEIGAGLGEFAGKVWRFGCMGHSARLDTVLLCLEALSAVLADLGRPLQPGAATAAACQAWGQAAPA